MRRTVRSMTLFRLALGITLGACASSPSRPTSTADTSANSLEWAGVYLGTLPCADCQGIETAMLIRPDGSYQLATKYLGKPGDLRVQHGVIAWNAAQNQITLSGVTDAPNRYLVGERQLVQLDTAGQRVTGELAERYVLRKQGNAATPAAPTPAASMLTVPSSWTLIELNGKPLPALAAPATTPTLTFSADSNRVSGSSGCNSFGGTFTMAAGNRLSFSPLVMTRRACGDMSVESAYTKALESTDSYAVNGDELQLHRARMAPLAKFRRVTAK